MLHIFSLHTFSDMVLSQAPPIPRRNNRDKIIKRITKPTTTTRAPSDDETSEDCPEPYGFFADADQCDKYHACSDGRIEGEWEWSRTLEMLNQQAMTNQYFICLPERLCPDGLVFNDYDIEVEKCDLPYNIDCSKRPLLRMLKPLNWSWNYRIIIFHSCTEEPKPSNHCPRQNGYFGHADKGVCGKIDGVFFLSAANNCSTLIQMSKFDELNHFHMFLSIHIYVACADKFYYCVDGMFNMITCREWF